MNDDTIYRQAAIAAINSRKSYIKPSGPYDEYSEGRYDAYEAAIDELEELPSARPKGKWILNRDGNWCCPFCGNDPYHDNMKNMNFCPNCGADMRGEQDG